VFDEVLTVVEDQQGGTVGEHRRQPRHRIPRVAGSGHPVRVAHPERAQQRLRHLGAVAGPGQSDEAHLARVPSGRLDRQPGLSRASGADQCDQPLGGQRPFDGGQFVGPSYESAQLGGERMADGLVRDRVRAQYGEVCPVQLGAGVGAEVLGQGPARLLVHRQRLGALPGAVQRVHQLGAQPLPQWVGGDQVA
jgi:hypothetical protein